MQVTWKPTQITEKARLSTDPPQGHKDRCPAPLLDAIFGREGGKHWTTEHLLKWTVWKQKGCFILNFFQAFYFVLGYSLPGSSNGKESWQGRRPRFDPWVRKIPWRREWLPTPVFLPGECHGQRSLVGSWWSMGWQRVRHDRATNTFTCT